MGMHFPRSWIFEHDIIVKFKKEIITGEISRRESWI